MSKRNLGERIKLQSYGEMFGEEKETEVIVSEQIKDVALSELHPFKNHPFKVLDDEKMAEMVESVKQYGILVPAIARIRAEGGYELISGHRRHHAATLAGLDTMPVMIKDCDDDESTVIMVDANIQREDISISEKAKAYRMKYDAMKHQGVSGGSSLAEMSESAGESSKTIQRLIYLSNLSDELLELIDSKKLGIAQGVDLAFLSKEKQEIVLSVMEKTGIYVNMEQSARIKNAVKEGLFNEQWLLEILSYKKPPVRKVVFNQNKLDSYFEPNMTNEDIEGIIVKLLDEWKAKGGQD
ncbi:ParB/RepB/Spo0J family partition protein [Roseburia sp. 499]|uniref:ParB/RepB/Spo0J family partition protein n=1 Tax=Roseburia sp. 499 TaxID=1261634 RepID=UPI000950F3B9|nr:ParB/RepB/Spo0J family partition protein [Roseburia sp. 499]WVK69883.1 ParB/RepB/Spo0J family partition protein [Roseburia sp. 499]